MNYTSIEESKKLIELGLNRDTADLVYQFNFLIEENDDQPNFVSGSLHDTPLENIPCWSIGALLKVMPKCIVVEHRNYFSYIVCLDTVSYEDTKGNVIIRFHYDTLFDSIYAIVVWLLENNYVKKD